MTSVFDMFRDQWTPITFTKAVPRNKPVRVRAAGEDVALFRDAEGRLGALIDRCPHRGVALSLGRVTEEGTLECPFHGWKFERDGACAKVPFCDLSAEKRERLGAISVPVREIAGMVWIFTGEDPAGSEPDVPTSLTEPGWSHFQFAEEWTTHWTRAMENMLDYPHLPYVHQRSIGRELRAPAERGGQLVLRTEPTSFGMNIVADVDGKPGGAGLDWRRPNGMVLHLDFGSRRMKQHVYCVPVDEKTTRMILISTRDFGLFWLFRPFFWLGDWSNTWILHEDRAVVESSQPPEVPRAGEEKSVATDAPTLIFRRWYWKTLKDRNHDRESADVPVTALVRRNGLREEALLDADQDPGTPTGENPRVAS